VLRYDDELVNFIQSFPVFNVKRNDENVPEKKSFYNSYNLVPSVHTYGHALGTEYEYKILCKQVESASKYSFEELFIEKPLSFVWDQMALIKAVTW